MIIFNNFFRNKQVSFFFSSINNFSLSPCTPLSYMFIFHTLFRKKMKEKEIKAFFLEGKNIHFKLSIRIYMCDKSIKHIYNQEWEIL